MRAIGLVLLSMAIMALLLTEADAKRRSSAQGSQAAGAGRSWCVTSPIDISHAAMPPARGRDWHFERDPIPYALETDWPVGAAGFEPVHPNQSRWTRPTSASRCASSSPAPRAESLGEFKF
jgi:hypothetical protein